MATVSSPHSAPTVTFWGAARSVTGSMHLVESRGQRFLLDCGQSRTRTHHGLEPPPPFPCAPADLHAAIVSHAHMDHCGQLPLLVRHGFRGPIYCTPATAELLALMLSYSARIQEEEAHIRSVVGGPDADVPEFSRRQDVERVLQQCVPLPYEQEREIGIGVQLRLVNAGHILGSAITLLTMNATGNRRSLAFTGDLGRRQALLLGSPQPIPPADLVISESTYGGRELEPPVRATERLAAVVRQTVERDGKVLIPTFSLGRAQVVVACLQAAMAHHQIPAIPIFVDSPLAAEIAAVYRRHAEELALDPACDRSTFLNGSAVQYLRTHEESKAASAHRCPAVLLAPGGMCEGGRILYHLKQHIDDPRCTVVLVNYQAPGTPGRQLLERGPTVRFHGRKWNKWAEVVYLAGFSGHADHNDLMASLAPLAPTTRTICLVHGEIEQAEALATSLWAARYAEVLIPAHGEQLSL